MKYTVCYKMHSADSIREKDVDARSKYEAYDKVAFEEIDGEYPYSAWVKSRTFDNGRVQEFNTFEGKAY